MLRSFVRLIIESDDAEQDNLAPNASIDNVREIYRLEYIIDQIDRLARRRFDHAGRQLGFHAGMFVADAKRRLHRLLGEEIVALQNVFLYHWMGMAKDEPFDPDEGHEAGGIAKLSDEDIDAWIKKRAGGPEGFLQDEEAQAHLDWMLAQREKRSGKKYRRYTTASCDRAPKFIKAIVEQLKQGIPEHTNDRLVLFHKMLNAVHDSGMIVDDVYPADELTRLSVGDPKWDREVEKLLQRESVERFSRSFLIESTVNDRVKNALEHAEFLYDSSSLGELQAFYRQLGKMMLHKMSVMLNEMISDTTAFVDDKERLSVLEDLEATINTFIETNEAWPGAEDDIETNFGRKLRIVKDEDED